MSNSLVHSSIGTTSPALRAGNSNFQIPNFNKNKWNNWTLHHWIIHWKLIIASLKIPVRRTGSVCLLADNFRFYFTGSLTLLFTFPSRYSYTLGSFKYLALLRGRSRFLPKFTVFWSTQESLRADLIFKYRAVTFCGQSFQTILLTSSVPC